MTAGFIYEQSTGRLLFGSGDRAWPVAVGYAGFKDGRNAPAKESERLVGPIPRGRYRIVERSHPRFKAPAFYLEPDAETAKRVADYGRGGFWIHGDNGAGTASRGCPVFDLGKRTWVRTMIAEGFAEPILVVVSGERPKGR